MKKTVLVINGAGGVGKDTLCHFAARHFAVRNISSITPIKKLASQCGWNGEKTDAARKFLSDLKKAAIEYNDYPLQWVMNRYRAFMASDDLILFVHIREPEEIEKFVRATGGHARTLLVQGNHAKARQAAFGNPSDDRVEDYPYDYYYENNTPLHEAEPHFVRFIKDILRNEADRP
ncbi:MAG: hypothetical protein WDA00_02405 [Eubacteriales bacterium]